MAKESRRQEKNALRGNNIVPKANCLREMRNRSATFRDVSVAFEWTNMSVKMVHHLLSSHLSNGYRQREHSSGSRSTAPIQLGQLLRRLTLRF